MRAAVAIAGSFVVSAGVGASVVGCNGLLGIDVIHDRDAGASVPDVSGPSGCFPAPSGLVSWWRAEGDATDSVGANPGALTNVTYDTGMVGQAFHFEGTGYVLASATGFPSGSADRTAEAWIRMDETFVGPTFAVGLFLGYGQWAHTTGTYEVLVLAGGTNDIAANTFGFSQWGNSLIGSTPLVSHQWQHVAVTLANNTVALYIDGQVIPSRLSPPNGPALAIDTPPGGSTYLGGMPESIYGPAGVTSSWLAGDVDEAAVYSRALSPEEIEGIFNAGSSGKCL